MDVFPSQTDQPSDKEKTYGHFNIDFSKFEYSTLKTKLFDGANMANIMKKTFYFFQIMLLLKNIITCHVAAMQ